MKLNEREVEIVSFGGIDMRDYPELCDAYIENARFTDTGEELTEEQIDTFHEMYKCDVNGLAAIEAVEGMLETGVDTLYSRAYTVHS